MCTEQVLKSFLQ